MPNRERQSQAFFPHLQSLKIFAGNVVEMARNWRADDVTSDWVLAKRTVVQINALGKDDTTSRSLLLTKAEWYQILQSPLALQVIAGALLEKNWVRDALIYYRVAASIEPGSMRKATDPTTYHEQAKQGFIDALQRTTSQAEEILGSTPTRRINAERMIEQVIINAQMYRRTHEKDATDMEAIIQSAQVLKPE